MLLAACGSMDYPAAARPHWQAGEAHWFQLERLDEHGQVRQTSLLSVQGEADGNTRWVQTDAFGAPQARLIATEHGWRQDGFARPNREAQQLFAALFPYLQSMDFRRPQIINGWRIRLLEQTDS